VLVADDHALVRHGFRSILASEEDIDVIAEAGNGRDAVAIATREQPDVVLMDIRMPGLDGIEATRLITADSRLSGTRVIVLTTFDLDEYIFGALRAGASGFLLKGVEPTELVNAVRTVAGGEALLEPSATRRLIEAYTSGATDERRSPLPLPEELTAREIELLTLIAGGSTNGDRRASGDQPANCEVARLANPHEDVGPRPDPARGHGLREWARRPRSY
jgi:DNA-binding NarL/FixJ family response regulator